MLRISSDDVVDVLQLLLERLGYAFRQPGSSRLQQFLQVRAEAVGDRDVKAYVSRCRRDAMEFQQLVNVVTNGLTAFFRDESQLEAIRSVIKEGGVHTIWCAGCSSGEEAYTLAAIAREERSDLEIVATDINTEALEHARDATYDPWSLRLMSPEQIPTMFDATPDGSYVVKPEIRSSVRFEHHNLMTPAPLSSADIVICRNVLIYFGESAIEKCLSSFRRVLGSNGLLILGSTEQLLGEHAFEVNQRAGGFVYQSRAGFIESSSTVMTSVIDEDASEIMSDTAMRSIVESGISSWYCEDLDTALACFEAATAYDPFWSDAHAMTGWLLEAIDAPRRAADAYNRAMFLDPKHGWSAYRAAAIWYDIGELATARRFARVAHLHLKDKQALDPMLRQLVTFDRDEIDDVLATVLGV